MLVLKFFVGGVIGAMIGFVTNFIAIRMMFFPKERKFGFQGLLPRYKDSFADKMSDFVLTFIDYEKIIDDVVENRDLSGFAITRPSNPISMALGFILANKVEESLEIPALRRRLIKELKKATPRFKEMLMQNIIDADIDVIIQLIFKYSYREIMIIQLIGAALGFLIGMLQQLIVCLM